MVGNHHNFSQLILAIFILIVELLSGCGRNMRNAPPAPQVQDAIAAALPVHAALIELEQEPLAIGPEDVKVNFKATVEVLEDLFTVEREADGLTKVKLLKRTQPSGSKVEFYGYLRAHRLIDQWTLDPPQFQKDFRPLGKPFHAFGAHAYLRGSTEAADALRRQTAEVEKIQQLQQTVSEQQERARQVLEEKQAREEQARKERLEKARLAFEEQHRKEREQRSLTVAQREQAAAAACQQLHAATASGMRYIGTRIGYNGSTQRIALTFLESKDAQLRAEVSNPDDPQEKRTFTGDLRFNAQPASNGAPAYTIVLHGLPSNKVNPERNSIYERSIAVKLSLTEHGLDGIADAGLGDQFPLHLQRAGGAKAK